MLEIMALIVHLDCHQPRVQFREFFKATRSYSYDAPPQGMAQSLFFNDLAQTTADYMDYAVRWADKCGAPTH